MKIPTKLLKNLLWWLSKEDKTRAAEYTSKIFCKGTELILTDGFSMIRHGLIQGEEEPFINETSLSINAAKKALVGAGDFIRADGISEAASFEYEACWNDGMARIDDPIKISFRPRQLENIAALARKMNINNLIFSIPTTRAGKNCTVLIEDENNVYEPGLRIQTVAVNQK